MNDSDNKENKQQLPEGSKTSRNPFKRAVEGLRSLVSSKQVAVETPVDTSPATEDEISKAFSDVSKNGKGAQEDSKVLVQNAFNITKDLLYRVNEETRQELIGNMGGKIGEVLETVKAKRNYQDFQGVLDTQNLSPSPLTVLTYKAPEEVLVPEFLPNIPGESAAPPNIDIPSVQRVRADTVYSDAPAAGTFAGASDIPPPNIEIPSVQRVRSDPSEVYDKSPMAIAIEEGKVASGGPRVEPLNLAPAPYDITSTKASESKVDVDLDSLLNSGAAQNVSVRGRANSVYDDVPTAGMFTGAADVMTPPSLDIPAGPRGEIDPTLRKALEDLNALESLDFKGPVAQQGVKTVFEAQPEKIEISEMAQPKQAVSISAESSDLDAMDKQLASLLPAGGKVNIDPDEAKQLVDRLAQGVEEKRIADIPPPPNIDIPSVQRMRSDTVYVPMPVSDNDIPVNSRVRAGTVYSDAPAAATFAGAADVMTPPSIEIPAVVRPRDRRDTEFSPMPVSTEPASELQTQSATKEQTPMERALSEVLGNIALNIQTLDSNEFKGQHDNIVKAASEVLVGAVFESQKQMDVETAQVYEVAIKPAMNKLVTGMIESIETQIPKTLEAVGLSYNGKLDDKLIEYQDSKPENLFMNDVLQAVPSFTNGEWLKQLTEVADTIKDKTKEEVMVQPAKDMGASSPSPEERQKVATTPDILERHKDLSTSPFSRIAPVHNVAPVAVEEKPGLLTRIATALKVLVGKDKDTSRQVSHTPKEGRESLTNSGTLNGERKEVIDEGRSIRLERMYEALRGRLVVGDKTAKALGQAQGQQPEKGAEHPHT